MRDFRDAKSMAQTLRESLTHKALPISHSESLELVSRMLGVADWNTLSAMLRDFRPNVKQPPNAIVDNTTFYPVIPIRDIVPFPGMTFPLFIGRPKTMEALNQAFARKREVMLAVQKSPDIDQPTHKDVHDIGTLAQLLDVDLFADGTMKALVQVLRRVEIRAFTDESNAFQARVNDLDEGPVVDATDLIRNAVQRFKDYAARRDIRIVATFQPLEQLRDPGRVADLIASHMALPLLHKQNLLEMLDPVARLRTVHELMEQIVEPPRSAELSATLQRALACASARRHGFATLEHLLLAITEDRDAVLILQACHVDLQLLQGKMASYVDTGLQRLVRNELHDPVPTAAFQRVTRNAGLQALESGHATTSGADILVALFSEFESPAARLLFEQRLTRKDALEAIVQAA